LFESHVDQFSQNVALIMNTRAIVSDSFEIGSNINNFPVKFHAKFGLKAWRKDLGLTQKTVSKRAGITQSALSRMERPETNHRTATLEKPAKAMGIETAQLAD